MANLLAWQFHCGGKNGVNVVENGLIFLISILMLLFCSVETQIS